jgi:hypothetical protein
VCAALCLPATAQPLSPAALDLLASFPRPALGNSVQDLRVVRAPAAEPTPAPERASLPLTLRLAGASSGVPLLMQLPQEQIPGQYTRPKYALGFQSETMRRWAKDFGLDAETCFAPIVRARTRLSQDGGISGSLMMQARCSFH